MMLTSAMSNAVNNAAKIQNVVCTLDAGIAEIAAFVGMRFWITHG